MGRGGQGRVCRRATELWDSWALAGAKAAASWRWYNYDSEQAAPTREVLRLNLDETYVCLHQGGSKGNVFITKGVRASRQTARWKRRCGLTHVALICDQVSIQPQLPQFIVGNFVAFKAAQMPGLREACPPNVVLVRQRRAWNNQVLCARIIRCLAAVLAPYMDRFQPVLLLDAAKLHCTHLVLRACRDTGIRACPSLDNRSVAGVGHRRIRAVQMAIAEVVSRRACAVGWRGPVHGRISPMRLRRGAACSPGRRLGGSFQQERLREFAT